MGAALTYARRYALFTLVGIAGEDDLDAPDLEAVPATKAYPPNGSAGQASNGHAHATEASSSRRRAPVARPVPAILAADLSTQLRDRLLGELSGLQSSDEAANWAKRSLPAKHTLIVADAQLVEDGFRIKTAALEAAQHGEPLETAQNPNPAIAKTQESLPIGPGNGRGRIAAKTIRLRDKDHRKFVSPHSPARCADVCRQMPTICALPSLAPSGAKSATSSPFRCAVSIIASCTGMVTRPRGGKRSRSIRCRSRAGCGSTRGPTARW
jgi:hypothetical protein